MKKLDEIFIANSCDKSSQYHNYAHVYEEIMHWSREKPVKLLEMGIQFGQSMKSWFQIFPHPEAHFFGMDIAHEFKTQEPRYTFHQCDQANADVLLFAAELFDYIIDDAGHYASPQAAAFHYLWPSLKPGGVYFIEDTWTLFHPFWKSSLSTGDWLYELFSGLNKGGKQFHGRPGGNMTDGALNYFEKSIACISSYPGLIVIQKKHE